MAVVQTVVPDYRRRFFEDLAERLGSRLVLVAGDEDWEPGMRHVDDLAQVAVRNVFVGRRRILWQSGVLRAAVPADVAVFDLNPRIASTWIALLLRRLRRRRSLLWGHAWPRRGRSSRTERVRRVMRRLADTLVVYTETEAAELAGDDQNVDVVAAPNALYRREELRSTDAKGPRTDLVCVGRMTPAKRPDLLLDGFLAASSTLPSDVRLVFVGDGPLRPELEDRSRRAGAGERIVFAGHRSSVDELRRVYDRALASVSPGYAGLSVIQSLGFGVPMIIARDADHAPEIEAAVDGVNAVFFSPSSPCTLAMAISRVVQERERWGARQAEIAEAVANRYTIEHMVDFFVSALEQRSSRTAPEQRQPEGSR